MTIIQGKSRALMDQPLVIRRANMDHRRWSRIDLITQQDRWWVDAHSNIRDINKIAPDYQDALLDFFRKSEWRIHFFSLGGWDAYEEVSEIFGSTMPKPGWIEEQPLVAKLRGIIEAR
jgi:hypothetical protein